MKIAMIGQKGIPAKWGGVERHVEALSTRLAAMEHDVIVYTRGWYSPRSPKKLNGVRCVKLPSVRTKHLDTITHSFLATLHALRAKADVIHYHGVGPALLSWIPRIFAPKVKVVATFHCIDRNHQKWGFMARLTLRLGEAAACVFAHETIAVSRTLQHYCKELYGKNARYIPNGVAVAEPRTKSKRTLETFSLTPGRYILMVSRLIRHKGAHELIEAFLKIKSARTKNKFKLVIVGDSSFTDTYARRVRELAGKHQDIVLTGALSGERLAHLFSGAYCLVHPSTSEGMPLAVLEAMAYGKAALVSDIPEHHEVIRDDGFTFRTHDVADLARKLSYLLSHEELAKKVGRRARKRALLRHNWDAIALQTAELYNSLTASGKKLSVTPALSGT